jgi:hypothetical protein
MTVPVPTHRFTVDEFQRMAAAGVFHDDAHVELIDGQVVEMTAIGPRHASCVDRLTREFSERGARERSCACRARWYSAATANPNPTWHS